MAKDIEKIIEESYVPDMEFVKPIKKTGPVEVPEIVLPKTKAEEYREAKGRLEQETSAVSKAFRAGKGKSVKRPGAPRPPRVSQREKHVKTVELDSAAAAVVGANSNAEHEDTEKLRSRLNSLREIVEAPKWVGSSDELIPFAWRKPLIADIERPSKYYRAAIKAEKNRAELLPAPRERAK